MNVGTKSVLFGAHQFAIHPWFVAAGWYKLYGFPWDPRLWVAFFVHDIGYFGKPNMDGPEGELHPYTGAKIMRVFGEHWYEFTLYHSRFLAKAQSKQPSRLCIADKLAITLTPSWLYVPMACLSGEIWEYRQNAARDNEGLLTTSHWSWHKGVREYCRKWAYDHKDGQEDKVTPIRRQAIDEDGVWR